MDIKLVVLRTGDTKKLSDFYTLLGIAFEYHKHENSPLHYSALVGQTVLEIYPLLKDQTEADKHLRIGFSVDNFETLVEKFDAVPLSTEFGRKPELYKK